VVNESSWTTRGFRQPLMIGWCGFVSTWANKAWIPTCKSPTCQRLATAGVSCAAWLFVWIQALIAQMYANPQTWHLIIRIPTNPLVFQPDTFTTMLNHCPDMEVFPHTGRVPNGTSSHIPPVWGYAPHMEVHSQNGGYTLRMMGIPP
jgi:hypothetical protein